MGYLEENQPNIVRRTAALWTQKIQAGVRARSTFDKVADQIRMFLYAPQGFIWDQGYRQKFKLPIEDKPKFPVTINKAFEAIAIIGPYIYWRYATRKVQATKPLQIDPAAFGDLENNPELAARYQQFQAEQQQQAARTDTIAQLMEGWLNYTQRAQSGKGLLTQGRILINDMLICGRGVAWPQVYYPPGSDQKMTGLFRDHWKNLVIDPDCTDPNLEDATWIARRHVTASWQLERMWNRRRGSLKQYATIEGNDGAAERRVKKNDTESSQDWVVWYEVYSKCGFGGNLKNSVRGDADKYGEELLSPFEKMIEEDVGDYAYLAIIPGCNVILNLDKPLTEMTADEMGERFAWPFESYKANAWPCVLYDCYQDSDGPWPIPPLGPALGHLICVSVLTAAYVEKAWESRKDIIAVLDTYKTTLTEALNSNTNEKIVELSGAINKSISDCIAFLQRPEMNYDILKAIEFEMEQFARSSGLYDFLYAASNGIERSAEGTKAKAQASSVRPDDMAEKFAQFMSDASTMEMILAADRLKGSDVVDALGAGSDFLWDEFVGTMTDGEKWRGARVTVSATEMRKPDKQKDLADIQAVMQALMPFAQVHAQQTGDVSTINQIMEKLCDALNMETPIQFAPMTPPPEAQQQQQRAAEAEVQETEASARLKDAQAQAAMEGVQGEAAKAELDLHVAETKMQMDAASQQQKMALDAQAQEQKLQFEREKAAMDMQRSAQEMEVDQAKSEMELRNSAMMNDLQLRSAAMKTAQGVRHAESMSKVKEKAAAKAGVSKPASKG